MDNVLLKLAKIRQAKRVRTRCSYVKSITKNQLMTIFSFFYPKKTDIEFKYNRIESVLRLRSRRCYAWAKLKSNTIAVKCITIKRAN